MRPRVLVTRPEPGASATAARLAQAGLEPVLLPLTEIVPLDPVLPRGGCDLVAVTSANAVRHAPAKLIAQIAGIRCLAVGDETARAAEAAGVIDVVSTRGDANALASAALGATIEASRVLYIAGKVRRPTFEQTVRAAGREIVTVETYDTVPVAKTAAMPGQIDAVLLYSAVAAELLAARPDAAPALDGARFFGLSSRIGEALPLRWREKFLAAGTADEDGLFRLLERLSLSAP